MRIASAAVIVLLAASPAAAQGTTSPSGQPSAPSTTPSTKPSGTTEMPKSSGQLQLYNHQPGEMRASKLIGATVRNDANDSIGEINEIIVSKDGQAAAAVIGVGGFLGIGEREVAVDFKALRIEYDSTALTDRGAITVKLAATKDSLKNAPPWSWSDRGGRPTDTGTATGSAPGSATKPSDRPANNAPANR
jgi:hypothetical protein